MFLTRTIKLGQTGSADPGLVWERYAELGRWPSWSPQIRRVDALGERIRPGLTGEVHTYAPVPARFRILEVDEVQRRWSWEVVLGPVRLDLDHAVAAHPRGSSTTLVLRGPLPVVLAYAPMAAWALRNLVRPERGPATGRAN